MDAFCMNENPAYQMILLKIQDKPFKFVDNLYVAEHKLGVCLGNNRSNLGAAFLQVERFTLAVSNDNDPSKRAL